MKESVPALFSIGLVLVTVACRGESTRGDCKLHRPEQSVRIEHVLFSTNRIVRRHAEPDALLFLTGAGNDKVFEALKIDLGTGKQGPDSMPYEKNPPGYTRFAGGQYFESHPLIASKNLRFEYLGKMSSVHRPSRNYDGDWSIATEKYFTGTRRIIYGNRPLLEQDFENYVGIIGIEDYVQIEPDGDRLVCMCTDLRGTWLAIFSKKKLEAEQKGAGGK